MTFCKRWFKKEHQPHLEQCNNCREYHYTKVSCAAKLPALDPADCRSEAMENEGGVVHQNPDFDKALLIAHVTASNLITVTGIGEATAKQMLEKDLRSVYDLIHYNGDNKRWIKLREVAKEEYKWNLR